MDSGTQPTPTYLPSGHLRMLIVESLQKSFQLDEDEIRAVDDLSFEVKPGEVYGLLGPNGAGKTTTLRMVLGLVKPDSGYAEVGGYRTAVDPTAVKSRLGFVSASDGVYPWLTVREMLLYFADLYGVPHSEASARCEHLAELMGIKPLLDRRAGTLSTGQRQRVTLVRGLIHDPPVMLLDEPTRAWMSSACKPFLNTSSISEKLEKRWWYAPTAWTKPNDFVTASDYCTKAGCSRQGPSSNFDSKVGMIT